MSGFLCEHWGWKLSFLCLSHRNPAEPSSHLISFCCRPHLVAQASPQFTSLCTFKLRTILLPQSPSGRIKGMSRHTGLCFILSPLPTPKAFLPQTRYRRAGTDANGKEFSLARGAVLDAEAITVLAWQGRQTENLLF